MIGFTKGIIFSTGTIGLWILLQLFFLNVIQTRHRFRLILKLYFFSLGLYLLFQGIVPPHGILDFLNGLSLHVLLLYAYFLAYYGVERPITLRILVELYNAPRKATTVAGIQSEYNLQDILEKRLNSLADNGYIRHTKGRFFPTARGIFIAKILWWGSRIYGKREN